MSEWIEWSGGVCPVPDGTLVDVEYRDGECRYSLPANENFGSSNDAGCAYWCHDGADNDIVRYRVCQSVLPEVTSNIPMPKCKPPKVSDHPLEAIFADALAQVTKGKGAERHSNGAEFMDQPWLALANTHGNGFLTGQSQKKIMEAQGMTEHDRWEREMLGAIVYAAMAIIHRRGML